MATCQFPNYVAIGCKPENGCQIQNGCCGKTGIMMALQEELELNDDEDKCLHMLHLLCTCTVPGGKLSVLTVTLLLLLQQCNCIPGTFVSLVW
jgi:hypothetical protein